VFQERTAKYELIARGRELEYIFHPRSIALVGISSDPKNFTAGHGFLKGLLEFGYCGQIYPINPKAAQILGLKAYPSVRDAPETVDHAISLVPAPLTPQLIEDCGAKGVKVVHLYTAGFAETGEKEGERLQAELLARARRLGIRIIGPNCMGIHYPENGITFDMRLPQGAKESGRISFLSQSGGNAVDLVHAGPFRGLYFNKVVSYGNAIDLNESDFLENFAADPNTEIIAAYIEGIKDGRRFWQALKEAAKFKPVIVLKGGRTAAGAGAVGSHSASMAGNEDVWKTLLKQAGAIRAYTMDELADLLVVFSHLRPLAGRNAGVIGVGGGNSVEAADLCEAAGLFVPALPIDIRKQLREFTPEAGTGIRNPIDTTNLFSPKELSRTIELVAGCAGIDFLMIQHQLGISFLRDEGRALFEAALDAMIETAVGIAKPVTITLRHRGGAQGMSLLAETQEKCVKAGLAVIPSIERAAIAISRFVSYHEHRNGVQPRGAGI